MSENAPRNYEIRRATLAELPACAGYAGQLVRMHYAWDPARYLLVEGVEKGYLRYFQSEHENPDVVIAVCVHAAAAEVVGYSYAKYEGRDWNALLDEAGWIHDIYVTDAHRRSAVASLLLAYTERELHKRGARRVVLQVAAQNSAGKATFERAGFRPTLAEYTKNLPDLLPPE
jgi:ribosomal protein S18 acetylase RimI-like enzyme